MQIANIVKLAVSAPSADNSQPWQWCVDSGALYCSYHHRSPIPDPFGPMGHASLVSSGALLENISVISEPQKDIQIEWRSTKSSWQVVLNNFQQIADISAVTTERLLSRHTDRHPYLPLASNDLIGIPTSPVCRAISVVDPDSIRLLATAIQKASAARFNCKELHEWLFSSIRWTPEEIDSGTGLDINTLHLPPGGRTFMHWISPWQRMKILNRFGVGRLMAFADAAMVRESPAIIAIVGGDSHQEAVEGGRLMQRIWLELNSRNISIHPYYVLTDLLNRRAAGKLDSSWHSEIDDAIAITRGTLNLSPGERVHMLLRAGKPTCAPVRSKRLPVSMFFDKLPGN